MRVLRSQLGGWPSYLDKVPTNSVLNNQQQQLRRCRRGQGIYTRVATTMIDLDTLCRNAHAIACEKGFWQDDRDPLAVLALIHSEVSEALEDIRDGKPLHQLEFEEGTGKPTGVPAELADIIIRVLDACGAWGINIEEAIRAKVVYNQTRPKLHGRKR